MHTLDVKDLIDRAKLIEADQHQPAVINVMIAGKSYHLASTEAKEVVRLYCLELNKALMEKRDRALWSNIPVTGFFEPDNNQSGETP